MLALVDGALLAVMLRVHTSSPPAASALRARTRSPSLFCGSQKSLVTGIPMANALFAGSTLGFVVLPLIIYHQMQFMTCAALARRYAAARPDGPYQPR